MNERERKRRRRERLRRELLELATWGIVLAGAAWVVVKGPW